MTHSNHTYHLDGCWTPAGWLCPAYVGVDSQGIIQTLQTTPPSFPTTIETVRGYALPGFYNAHSHAFQYAMAGTAEHLPQGALGDDFWSWRETMYQLALCVDPDSMEHIAAMLYAEMLRVGYTHVAEFHYLHHQPDGTPYAHRAEMAERLLQAAKTAGISITMIPIFYQKGGFNQEATPRQRRFLSRNVDDFLRLWQDIDAVVSRYPQAHSGMGVHSLRAVTCEDVIETFRQAPAHLPRHIHVAEQRKEVEDCLSVLGTRPVQWLLDHLPLDSTYHLVHATHTSEDELISLAKSGASVVLCPSTEGNLGDGRFDLVTYRQHSGTWSIGTDSHIHLFPNEELQLLDYNQRMTHHRRNIFCQHPNEDSGVIAFQEPWLAGRAAMGLPSRPCGLLVGQPLDAVIYDAQSPLLVTVLPEHLLSTILYACDPAHILGTMVGGQWVVQHNKHRKEQAILGAFQQTMLNLSRDIP